jgi:RNA polymerase sigma-70 factor (ECF subfamily)
MQAQRQIIPNDHVNTATVPDVTLLVRRARAGDHDAFAGIYRLHVDRIYALCLRLCADRELAATLCQDAFVRAWQKLGSFREESQLLTWLHRLTVNVVLDHRRSVQRRNRTEQAQGDDLDIFALPTPDQPGIRMDLETAVRTLPPGARTVFVLHDVEGYRMREIAEMTDIHLGTVKSQLHRARHLLREVLA